MEAILEKFGNAISTVVDRLDKNDERIDDLNSKLDVVLSRLEDKSSSTLFSTPSETKYHIPPTTETFGSYARKNPMQRKPDPNKRTSIWDEVTTRRDYDLPTMIFEKKPYDGVRLEELKVSKVLKFIDDVNRYIASTGVDARIGTLFSEEAMLQLIAKADGRLKRGSFYHESPHVILEELQKALRPGNAAMFTAELEDNVFFRTPKGYFLEPTNIEVFYDAILDYQNRFCFVCDFLSEDNAASVPPITYRKGGLIKTFINKIPYGYGENIMSTLNKSSYDNMNTFLDEFLGVVKGHKEASVKISHVMVFFNFSHVPEQPQFSRYKRENNRRSVAFDYRKPRESPKVAVVDAVDAIDAEDAADYDADIAAIGSYPTQPKGAGSKTQGQSSDTSQLPCHGKLFKQECPNPGTCRFSHDEALLAKYHSIYSRQLRSSPYAPKVLHLEDDISEDELAAINLLYSKLPELDIISTLSIGGDLILKNNEPVPMTKEQILLDTGARGASFISREFVDKHRGKITVRKLARSRSTTMANSVPVRIEEAARITLRFYDKQKRPHVMTSYFLIVEQLSIEIIVGVIDIALYLRDLFLELYSDGFARVAEKLGSTLHALEHPWMSFIEDEAPEEADLPCSFPTALHFLEMSHEEAVAEYRSQIDEHVSKEFMAAAPVKELLLDLGQQVFVPQS
jgi:hypothetical protein